MRARRGLELSRLAGLLLVLLPAALPFPAAGADAAQDPVERQRAELEAARVAAVDALAPRRFGEAVAAFEAAERDRARGRDAARVEAQLAVASAALADATRLAASTRQALPNFVEARAKAGRARAHERAPQAWTRAATRFAEAAQRAERGDLERARALAPEVEALMAAAELEAIQNEALAGARAQIAAAEAAKVGDLAPRTLADARRLVEQAAQEIARNRYDMVVPGELAQRAEYQARHARMLAETIAPLLAADRDEHALEALLLEWEAPLVRLATDLGISPRFDQGYLRPLDDMQKRVRELRQENDRLRASAGEQQQALADARLALAQAQAKLRFLESVAPPAPTLAPLPVPDGAPAPSLAPPPATGAATATTPVPATETAGPALPASAVAATPAVAPAPAPPAPAATAPVAPAPAASSPSGTAPAFAPDEAVLAQRGAYRTLTLTGLRFAVGAGAFDVSGHALLDRVCAALASEAGATFMVEGHVDAGGDPDAELALSQDRANSVRGYLVQRCGIPQERVLSMGYAGSLPVADNGTAEGRAANRRIVIEIQPATP